MRSRVYLSALMIVLLGALPRCSWGIVTPAYPSQPIQPFESSVTSGGRSGDDGKAVATTDIELPQGDPLTTPLNLSAAERGLFVDAEDGHLDEHSLVEAALIAAAPSDAVDIAAYRARFDALCKELHQRTIGLATVVEKIEIIHYLLHERVLRRYDADATRLATAFDTGVYNCASGTLLLIALATETGLDAHAIVLPGHVRAIVADGKITWEVEITSPRWSEAIREFSHESLPGEPRRHESTEQNRIKPTAHRPITGLGLIAMIYYNQGIDAFHQQRFATAIAANRRALLLDATNREARGNLLAAVNNWALALGEARDFAAAESLLIAGMKFDSSHGAFTHNIAYVRRLQVEAGESKATVN